MELRCPRCRSKTRELIECEICHEIGCPRCMKKSHGKWVCYKCKEPERYYHPEEEKIQSAFTSMFG